MTDNKDDKTIGVKKTLTLKPSGMSQGTVRQDMGRGRTKSVVVETVKRRPTRPLDEKPITPIVPAARARKLRRHRRRRALHRHRSSLRLRLHAVHQPASQQQRRNSNRSASGKSARRRVARSVGGENGSASSRAHEAQAREVEEAKQRAIDEERRKVEAAEAARIAAEEAARRALDPRSKSSRTGAHTGPLLSPLPRSRRFDRLLRQHRRTGLRAWPQSTGRRRRSRPARGLGRGKVAAPAPAKVRRPKVEEDRRRGKLTVTSANVDDDGTARGRSLASMRRPQENSAAARCRRPAKRSCARSFCRKPSPFRNCRSACPNAPSTSSST